MAHGAEVTARPRIPKLKYRNPLPDGRLSLDSRPASVDSNSNSNSNPNASLKDPRPPPLSPSSASTFSLASVASATSTTQPASENTSLRAISVASTPSNASSSNDSKSSKKKKKSKPNGVLGFLTLKEPSQLAFEKYAEQQRKQTSVKNGVSSPVGSSHYVTTKKLPESVPKVNSKWDGVPKSLKTKDSPSSSASTKKRNSTASRGSEFSKTSSAPTSPITPVSPDIPTGMSVLSFTSEGSYNPPNSLASAATSSSDVTIYGRRGSAQSETINSLSTDSLPEMTYYFPDNPNPSGVLSPVSVHANLPPATDSLPEITYYFPDNPDPSGTLPRSSIQNSLHNAIAGPGAPSSSRTATDESDEEIWDAAGVIFKKLNDRPHQGVLGESVIPEEEESDIVPESHGFLFDFPPTNEQSGSSTSSTTPGTSPRPLPDFSDSNSKPPQPTPKAPRPRVSMPYRPAPVVSRLSTLYEASIASTDTLTVAHTTSGKDSDAISTVSSATPSEATKPTARSPVERLRLSRNSSKNAALTAQDQGEPPEKSKKHRLSLFPKISSRT